MHPVRLLLRISRAGKTSAPGWLDPNYQTDFLLGLDVICSQQTQPMKRLDSNQTKPQPLSLVYTSLLICDAAALVRESKLFHVCPHCRSNQPHKARRRRPDPSYSYMSTALDQPNTTPLSNLNSIYYVDLEGKSMPEMLYTALSLMCLLHWLWIMLANPFVRLLLRDNDQHAHMK